MTLEQYTPILGVSYALSLDNIGKPLNLGVAVGAMKSAMSGLHTHYSHLSLKSSSTPQAIVCLHHGDSKPPYYLVGKPKDQI